jgi:hypothetical protein
MHRASRAQTAHARTRTLLARAMHFDECMLLTRPVESYLLSLDDDSYRALVDPYWLRMLAARTLSNPKPLVWKRFYVMRNCPCGG